MEATVAEIRELLRTASAEEFRAVERSLAADGRKGVASALEAARRRLQAEEAERQRVRALYEFDASHAEGRRLVVGLDEVGRGAVAGPLAVGAVVLPDEPLVYGLNDSKQLSADKRGEVAESVMRHAIAYSVFYVEPDFIDTNGMANALRRAFAGALADVESRGLDIGAVLIDGNPLGIDQREVNVVKGDAKSAAIAAASIVAKVQRDALMCSLSPDYPRYAFHHNKGYASAEHVQAIRDYGLSPVHRASFCTSFLQQTLF